MDTSEPTPLPRRTKAKPAAAPAEAAPAPAVPEGPKAKEKAPAAPKARKQPSPRIKPLNFRVTAEFRKAFKQAAAAEDCKKVELLERIFASWQASHPAS